MSNRTITLRIDLRAKLKRLCQSQIDCIPVPDTYLEYLLLQEQWLMEYAGIAFSGTDGWSKNTFLLVDEQKYVMALLKWG